MAEWTLTIPAPGPWLNANHRQHRYANARTVRAWREATVVHARNAQLPHGLERVRIDAVLAFPTRRRRDEANYHPTLKAIVDGLGPDRSRITKSGRPISAPGHGLIPDDTPTHLDGPHITFAGSLAAVSQVVLTITEVR